MQARGELHVTGSRRCASSNPHGLLVLCVPAGLPRCQPAESLAWRARCSPIPWQPSATVEPEQTHTRRRWTPGSRTRMMREHHRRLDAGAACHTLMRLPLCCFDRENPIRLSGWTLPHREDEKTPTMTLEKTPQQTHERRAGTPTSTVACWTLVCGVPRVHLELETRLVVPLSLRRRTHHKSRVSAGDISQLIHIFRLWSTSCRALDSAASLVTSYSRSVASTFLQQSRFEPENQASLGRGRELSLRRSIDHEHAVASQCLCVKCQLHVCDVMRDLQTLLAWVASCLIAGKRCATPHSAC
jgi:hypothetical protein